MSNYGKSGIIKKQQHVNTYQKGGQSNGYNKKDDGENEKNRGYLYNNIPEVILISAGGQKRELHC